MQTPTSFSVASAQAAAIPESIAVVLSTGASATVHRLSWLQFEALWGDMACVLGALAESPVGTPFMASAGNAEATAEAAAPRRGPANKWLDSDVRTGQAPSLQSALAAAPQLVLHLASQCLRLSESDVAQWPPADVLAAAAAGLELNFIAPAGVRDFFAAVGKLGKGE
jgi:hypothetical protein